jgi:hypothetical protein
MLRKRAFLKEETMRESRIGWGLVATVLAAAASFLFRVEGGEVVEHWDAIEAIPPRSEWKNDNGKF